MRSPQLKKSVQNNCTTKPTLSSWNRYKKILTKFKWVFTPLALVFLLAAIWQARGDIRETLAICLPVYLLLAVGVWALGHMLSPLFVAIILKACGSKVSYRQLLDLHARYLPARYVPGGIWHTVARIGGLQHLGVPPRAVTTFVLLENMVAPGVTLSIGGLLVALNQQSSAWQLAAYLLALISLVLLMAGPIVVNRLVLKSGNRISVRSYLFALFLSIIFWSLAATSFLLFIYSMPNTFSNTAWVDIVGSYLFSWGIGFIAIFAPQGLGVFEVVAANTMPANIPFGSIVAFLAGFRLVVLLADVCVWLGWLVHNILKRYPKT